jgi:hypothetical protein
MTQVDTLPPGPVVVFDLDDTLRDSRHRHHLSPYSDPASSWRAFFDADAADPPLPGAVELTRSLRADCGIHIVTMAGNPRGVAGWLSRHDVRWDGLACLTHATAGVYPPGQTTGTLKQAHFRGLLAAGFDIRLVIDDSPEVTGAARELGIPAITVDAAWCGGECGHCAVLRARYEAVRQCL